MITEISIGPFTFEWDKDRHEVYISRWEEAVAMIECIDFATWYEFVDAARQGAAYPGWGQRP